MALLPIDDSPARSPKRLREEDAEPEAEPPLKRARTHVKHVYIPYGKTAMSAEVCVHTCSDPVRALAAREMVRALQPRGKYGEIASESDVYALLGHCMAGDWDGEDEESPLVKEALKKIGAPGPGVSETWADAMQNGLALDEGPFDSLTMYYIDVRDIF